MWDEAEVKTVFDNTVAIAAVAIAVRAGVSNTKTASVKSPDAARVISIFAEETMGLAISVGTSAQGGVVRLMLESVSRDVVSRAHCPVTVAR